MEAFPGIKLREGFFQSHLLPERPGIIPKKKSRLILDFHPLSLIPRDAPGGHSRKKKPHLAQGDLSPQSSGIGALGSAGEQRIPQEIPAGKAGKKAGEATQEGIFGVGIQGIGIQGIGIQGIGDSRNWGFEESGSKGSRDPRNWRFEELGI